MLIGFSEVNITPEPGYPLGGYIERYLRKKRATGKLNDIYARGIYLSDGVNEYIIISAEVLLFDNSFVKKAREEISKVVGVPEQHIMLVATHTHSAPETSLEILLFRFFYTQEDTQLITKYNEFLIKRLIDTARNAKRNATEASLLVGRTFVKDACKNRVDPTLETDEEVVILMDSHKRGAIISYTCHPTVLGATNTLYSGDFLSYTAERIKDCVAKDFIPVFLVGAAGDQSTRFVRKNQTPDEAKRIGSLIAGKICEKIAELEPLVVEEIRFLRKIIKLPRRDLAEEKFKEKLVTQMKKIEEELDKVTDKGVKRKLSQDLLTANLLLEIYDDFDEYLNKLPKEVDFEVCYLILDDIGLVFIPAELFCKYGLQIKRSLNLKYVIVAGYANGYFGYIPTEEAYKKFDYESLMSIFKKGVGDILVREIIEAIK